MEIWGDPLLSGTIFIVSYGVTALLIFKAAREAAARERHYWRLCGSLFLFQVVNTNLDLHALLGKLSSTVNFDRLRVYTGFID